MNKLLCGSFFVLLLTGCSKIGIVLNQFTSEKEMTSFSIISGRDTIKLNISDSTIEGIKPDTGQKKSMIALFSFKGKKVRIGESIQLSGETANDFTSPLTYVVEAKDGSVKNYKIKLRSFTGLPILYITSPPITSKDDYVTGKLKIDGNIDYDKNSYSMQIKGRGNSTWGQPKNPYKIKLSDKAGLLGMPADKEWALLASWFDKSLLRNDIAFELSERLQMAWTPRRRLVEVFLNGEYNGNYLLTETVKTAKDRLNITIMNGKDPVDTLSDYLMEADWQRSGEQSFATNGDIRFSMKEPEMVTARQLDYITKQTQNLEDLMSITDDLSGMIDIDSWIKWTIVNEVMRNRDANLYGSCFFYRGSNKRLFMGPVWDFDLSSGGYAGNDPTGWYVTTASLIGGAFQYNALYRARFKEIWNTNRDQITTIIEYVDRQVEKVKYSQQQNEIKWPIMTSVLYDGQIINPNYTAEINYLRNWLAKRIQWMDNELNK